jgi:hypothetical protein
VPPGFVPPLPPPSPPPRNSVPLPPPAANRKSKKHKKKQQEEETMDACMISSACLALAYDNLGDPNTSVQFLSSCEAEELVSHFNELEGQKENHVTASTTNRLKQAMIMQIHREKKSEGLGKLMSKKKAWAEWRKDGGIETWDVYDAMSRVGSILLENNSQGLCIVITRSYNQIRTLTTQFNKSLQWLLKLSLDAMLEEVNRMDFRTNHSQKKEKSEDEKSELRLQYTQSLRQFYQKFGDFGQIFSEKRIPIKSTSKKPPAQKKPANKKAKKTAKTKKNKSAPPKENKENDSTCENCSTRFFSGQGHRCLNARRRK